MSPQSVAKVMAIPDRLKLRPVEDKVFNHMMELCDFIERDVESGGDAMTLLNEWHKHANRRCDPHEFQAYWKSTDKETFVLSALYPEPAYDEDIQYSELAAVLNAVLHAAVPESEINYYIRWLEVQFPDSNIMDLMYWPDEWFENASLFRDASGEFKPDAALSVDQIIAYSMQKSGRSLRDAPPGVELPFPIPRQSLSD